MKLIEIKSKDTGETLLNIDADSLAYADFRGLNLSGADLSGADLRHADFSFSDLSEADLSMYNSHATKVIKTKFMEKTESSLLDLELDAIRGDIFDWSPSEKFDTAITTLNKRPKMQMICHQNLQKRIKTLKM